VFEEPMVLRGLAAAAAVTAVVGAVVMRRWDTQAGKRVADLTRARASDEWRFEERVAELEADLDESRELRQKLEQRLRAKRAELAGLRNEHAALLRRYATAETERASALEGRRLLELEAATPARALPAAEPEQSRPVRDEAESAAEEKPGLPALSSPEGARLFQRAGAALARLDADTKAKASAPDGGSDASGAGAPEVAPAAAGAGAVPAARAESGGTSETDGEPGDSVRADAKSAPSGTASVPRQAAKGGAERSGAERTGAEGSSAEPAGAERAAADAEAAREDEAQGKPEAVAGQEHSAAASPDGQPAPQPPTPARRPATEGGFDFFGTKSKGNAAALEAVQNEDLADVVGQEALDLHKAETEGGFRPATPAAAEQAAGQVIDLTAHDETERIDVQDLRTAAS
jgi:hypothetical protein